MSKLLPSKKTLKEKVVQLYEALIEGREPYIENNNFWNEFFLLKANGQAFDSILNAINNVSTIKPVVNLMSTQCIVAIKSDNNLRVANSLITLCSLSKVISDKWRQSHPKFDLIDHIIGREDLELKTQILIETLCNILINELPVSLKTLVIKFFLILVTTHENVNKNPLIDLLISDQLFDALIQTLNVHRQRHNYGYQMILLLTILLNYRKYESINPYIMKLSIVDDEVQLNGYARVISNELLVFNKNFHQINNESKPSGLFNTLTNMVGNMFIAEDNGIEANSLKTNNAVLLAFYEAIHLNRNFITLLTTSPTEVYAIANESTDTSNQINNDTLESIQSPPSNLLVAFLQFSSIVMIHTKDESILKTSRLCFIILTCITEDQCANAIMHDMNMPFTVQLHRMPMRHRKVNPQSTTSRPLSYSVMDLMIEFMLTHTRKNLLLDLYMLCIGVIHRLLCYQKKCKIRVDYAWKELWTALITLLKFVLSNESDLLKKCNVFTLAINVVNIFNLFITFGDTFLPSPQAYDELYYEIIRMHSVFEHLYSMTLRYASNEKAEYKESATRLASTLVNIKAIINHFNTKIESYSLQNQLSSLTEEQVLDVVRNNYDTLTLKLQDNLDQYDRYDPIKQCESKFFNDLLRFVINDYRKSLNITLNAEEQHILMQDLQMMSNLCNAINGDNI
ncbi:armadillo-like helical domain-containing protein 3 [Oppia nitens]|uniref:armadillo-like helical domain-containing protein 3 n=1 Tax=Oppia nitens TaxID=1686743 RepID=UPI0023DA5931|nr:armadillo-like helical domain-containing protein 3 [Oppia nitens]